MARKTASTDKLPRSLQGALLPEQIEGLARVLAEAWGGKPTNKRSANVPARMRDAAAVRQRLDEVSALGLAMLEVLVEAGGLCRAVAMQEILEERVGVSGDMLERAASEVAMAGLAAQVRMGSLQALALLTPNAAIVADAVLGVTLPSEPPASAGTGVTATADVEAIAAATMALHHEVKATKDGWVHRTSVKKHARRLEMDAGRLEERLEAASRGGAIVARDGRFDVDVDGLLAVARGDGASPRTRALLADGPVCAELLVRQLARSKLSGAGHYGPDLAEARDIAQQIVDDLRGVVRSESGGATWLSIPHLAELPTEPVEGFLTPSLEVMVGPDPDARVVARVGLGAELVRVDRVITFRLRPKTVANMVACGQDVGDLLEALELVGKHGVPDNVRAQILDWGGSAKVARARPAVLLRVRESQHDAARRALDDQGLGDAVLGALRPGELILGYDAYLDARAALAGAGFDVSGDVPPLARDEDDAGIDMTEVMLARITPPPLGVPRPDPALRDRVQRAVEDGFAESRRTLGRLVPKGGPRSAAEMREAMRARIDESLSATSKRAIAQVLDVHAKLEAQLEAWAAGYDGEARAYATTVVRTPLLCMPLLCLAPKHRQRLLTSTGHPDDVLEEAARLTQRGRLSPEGRRIVAAIPNAGFRDWLQSVSSIGLAQPGGDDLDDLDDLNDLDGAPSQPISDRIAGLHRAMETREIVDVWWRTPTGTSHAQVWVERLSQRGRRSVVLCTEATEQELGRAIPLEDILAVIP